MATTLQKTALLVSVLLAVCTACGPYSSPQRSGPPERTWDIFSAVQAKSRSFDRSPAWVRSSYKAISVRDIRSIPPEGYRAYRTFVQHGQVHLIVHPGYFPFFDEWSVTPIATDYSRRIPRSNIVERVGDALTGADVAYQVVLQQERITRDFIEYQSQKGNLVILVLPRNYREHLTYGYVPGYDEYARYINEMTNGADNILYIESQSHQSGYLNEDDLVLLGNFLDALGARTLLLGGGFVGKCLDNFAATLRKRYPFDAIWYVSELAILSPSEIIADRSTFLSFWGKLRQENIRKYLTSIPLNRTTREPLQWADLTLEPATGYRQ